MLKFVLLRICVLAVFTVSTLAFAQQSPKTESEAPNPGVIYSPVTGSKLLHMGEAKKRDVPNRAMFYMDGKKRVDLKQDFQFVVFRFKPEFSSVESRKDYYMKKVRLAQAELQPEELTSQGLYALKLIPGATEKKWNVLADYLKDDKEIVFVGRAFEGPKVDGNRSLDFLTDYIDVTFSTPPDSKTILTMEKQYSLKRNGSQLQKTIRFSSINPAKDAVDLANEIHLSGTVESARPVFSRVVSKKKLLPDKSKEMDLGPMMEMIRDSLKNDDAYRKTHKHP